MIEVARLLLQAPFIWLLVVLVIGAATFAFLDTRR